MGGIAESAVRLPVFSGSLLKRNETDRGFSATCQPLDSLLSGVRFIAAGRDPDSGAGKKRQGDFCRSLDLRYGQNLSATRSI